MYLCWPPGEDDHVIVGLQDHRWHECKVMNALSLPSPPLPFPTLMTIPALMYVPSELIHSKLTHPCPTYYLVRFNTSLSAHAAAAASRGNLSMPIM